MRQVYGYVERRRTLRTAAAAHTLRHDHLTALLPTLRLRRWQMFTANPAVGVFQNFAPQTLGVLNIVVDIRVLRVHVSRDYLREEKSTPGHSFLASTIQDESSIEIVPLQKAPRQVSLKEWRHNMLRPDREAIHLAGKIEQPHQYERHAADN